MKPMQYRLVNEAFILYNNLLENALVLQSSHPFSIRVTSLKMFQYPPFHASN